MQFVVKKAVSYTHLDIDTILFVRGKPLDMTIVDMAKNLHINLFQTDETMFEACGKLYEACLLYTSNH